jgi:hypothetical protein
MRWLPERDEGAVKPNELPVREQRLLLMRLASLFGPEAIAQAPRAARFATESEVRVVTGLTAVSRAIAEIDRLPDAVRSPGVSASFDEITQMMNPNANPESVARRPRRDVEMVDAARPGAGWHRGQEAPQAKSCWRSERDWILAVVRRMQRVTCHRGVEIARRLVRAAAQGMPSEGGRRARRPFFGIYLPAHPDNRQTSQRSLIGPEDKFTTGGMVELDTGNARYLIRFTQTLEQQAGWAWGMFNAVRKLSP